MRKLPRKVQVIGEIQRFLGSRTEIGIHYAGLRSRCRGGILLVRGMPVRENGGRLPGTRTEFDHLHRPADDRVQSACEKEMKN